MLASELASCAQRCPEHSCIPAALEQHAHGHSIAAGCDLPVCGMIRLLKLCHCMKKAKNASSKHERIFIALSAMDLFAPWRRAGGRKSISRQDVAAHGTWNACLACVRLHPSLHCAEWAKIQSRRLGRAFCSAGNLKLFAC